MICPNCGKECKAKPISVNGKCIAGSNCCSEPLFVSIKKQLPMDIEKILKKLEFEEKKKNSYYLMSPKEQKAIINYIKTGE